MNYHYEYSNVSRRMEIVVSKLEMRLLFPEDDWYTFLLGPTYDE